MMDQIQEFVDERQKAWCIHCGQWIAGIRTSRDHVPTKSILIAPYPENLPVVEVCRSCNAGFSADEEYLVAFFGCVLAGSADPQNQHHPAAARILQRNGNLRTRIEKARSECRTAGGDVRVVWQPEADRINRIILKNARGHAFHEFGEPMLAEPTRVWSAPLEALTAEERARFENTDLGTGWPGVGSRMLTRILTGQDLTEGWVVVQDGVYRYAVAQAGTMLVRTVLFEYLATEVYWKE